MKTLWIGVRLFKAIFIFSLPFILSGCTFNQVTHLKVWYINCFTSHPTWITDKDIKSDVDVKIISIPIEHDKGLARKISEFDFQESSNNLPNQPCVIIRVFENHGDFNQFSLDASGNISFEGANYEPIPEFNSWLCENIKDLSCIFCPDPR